MFPIALLTLLGTALASANTTATLDQMSRNGQPPLPRFAHTQVWTGDKLVVWGGAYWTDYNQGRFANRSDGGVYNPSSNTWSQLSQAGAPASRHNHSAVWTGSEMIVWGGCRSLGVESVETLNGGAIYNPTSNTWRPMASASSSFGVYGHTAVWTGNEMIVWGDDGGRSFGMAYNPVTDVWRQISSVGAPSRRVGHGAVWTGQAMAIWGGSPASEFNTDGTAPGTGALYFPATDSWQVISSLDAPAGGNGQGAYAGEQGVQLLSVGSKLGAAPINTFNETTASWLQEGGIYDLETGKWERIGTAGLPEGRPYMAFWSGQNLFSVGSSGNFFAAFVYDFVDRSWSEVASGETGSFQGRAGTWAPELNELLIFGGMWADGAGQYSGGPYGRGGFRLAVEEQSLPQQPIITSPSTASGKIGSAFSYKITADNDPTAFGATGLPAGLSVNAKTGLITGKPGVAGNFSVELTASNAGGTGSAVLNLTVAAAAAPPVITSPTVASGKADATFSYKIAADNAPTTFGATPLPVGLSVSPKTGRISGIPKVAGTFVINLSASNGAGTGFAVLNLIVSPGVPAPVITSPTSSSGQVGRAFSYKITADNLPTTFGAAGLPAGLSVNAKTGWITGTPTVAGSFPVTLTAGNASGTDSSVLTLTVAAAASPPVITSATRAKAKVGTAFEYRIKARNNPTRYNATTLPPGLTINKATGVISGKPKKAGVYSATLEATNINGSSSVGVIITVDKGSQTIKFAPRSTRKFEVGATFILSANATSRLGVTFTSSDPNILSINGRQATLVGRGRVIVTASQSGNEDYNPAKSVSKPIIIW